jgi:hypothetical protein
MSVHVYPPTAALSDYLRCGAGLLFAAVPLAAIETAPAVSAMLVFVLVVFSAYALHTLGRQLTHIEVDENCIRTRGLIAKNLPWKEINDLKLSYYSTRRDGTGGWLQLKLSGNGRRLEVDSRIDGFDVVAARAATAATRNGAKFDFATRHNFQALGIAVLEKPVEANP